MIRRALGLLRALVRAKLLSPANLLFFALVLAVPFAAAQLAGLRPYTAILSGTSVSASHTLSAALGLGYLVAWLVFVLVVPALLLAAAIAFAIHRLLSPTRGNRASAAWSNH